MKFPTLKSFFFMQTENEISIGILFDKIKLQFEIEIEEWQIYITSLYKINGRVKSVNDQDLKEDFCLDLRTTKNKKSKM
jgi:hypothetical protein